MYRFFEIPTARVKLEQFSNLSDAVEALEESETPLTRGPNLCVLAYLATRFGGRWNHYGALEYHYGLPIHFQRCLEKINDVSVLKSRRKKKVLWYLRTFLERAIILVETKTTQKKDEKENALVCR